MIRKHAKQQTVLNSHSYIINNALECVQISQKHNILNIVMKTRHMGNVYHNVVKKVYNIIFQKPQQQEIKQRKKYVKNNAMIYTLIEVKTVKLFISALIRAKIKMIIMNKVIITKANVYHLYNAVYNLLQNINIQQINKMNTKVQSASTHVKTVNMYRV